MTIVNGYCTLVQAKAELGITDAADDTLLEQSIAAASRQIDAETGWRFWQDGTAVARTFYPDDPRLLCVSEGGDGAGIATTTGLIVKLDVDDDGTFETTLTVTTDYIVAPVNAALRVPAWPYTELQLSGLGYWYRRSLYNRPTVQVTAKWGWPAVPDDITKACLIQAVQLYKAKDAVFGAVALGDAGATTRVRSALNPMAAALVKAYTKPAVG